MHLFCTWATLLGLAVHTPAVGELAWRDEVTEGPEDFSLCHLPHDILLIAEASQHEADCGGEVERHAGENECLFSSDGS